MVVVTWPAVAAARPSSKNVVAHPAVLQDRVIVARYGAAGITPTTMAPSDHGDADTYFTPYRLAQETPDRVRILVEEEDARVLLWIDRADLAWTVARPVRVRGTDAAGAWVLPGAPLTITGDGAQVAIHVADDEVALDGTLARTALRHRHRPAPTPGASTHTVRAIASAPGGPALIELEHELGVTVRDVGAPGWVMVEHRSDRVRILGWARAGEPSEGGQLTHGGGGGFGYGISDTDRVTLDRGTCLFDDRGAIVGVQTAPGERYASDLGGGRWSVYVGTNWGLHEVIAVDRHRGQGAPAWQRCQ